MLSESTLPTTVQSLVGEELNAISFVMNYVEFHYNSSVLRALAKPRVSVPNGVFEFPGVGSRDALCELIGATVQSIEYDDKSILRLAFMSGDFVTIPLDVRSKLSPDALHWCPRQGLMEVW